MKYGALVFGLTMICLGMHVLANASEGPSSIPIHIGTQKQLFLDDYIIDRTSAVRRNLHQAIPYEGNPIGVAEP